MMTTTCTCGCIEAHQVASRKTADGVTVVLWSDGGVSGVMGIGVWGEAARSPERHATYMRAGWLLMGEVGVYDARDVRRLVRTARRACEQKREEPLSYLRRVMAGLPYRAPAAAVIAPQDSASQLARRAAALGWEIDRLDVETGPEHSLLYFKLSRTHGDGGARLEVLLFADRHSASITREVVRFNERANEGTRYTGAWQYGFLGRERHPTAQAALAALGSYLKDNGARRLPMHRSTCGCIACLRGRLKAGLGLPVRLAVV